MNMGVQVRALWPDETLGGKLLVRLQQTQFAGAGDRFGAPLTSSLPKILRCAL